MSLVGFLKRNNQNILFFLIVFSVLFFLNSKFKIIEGLTLPKSAVPPPVTPASAGAAYAAYAARPKPASTKIGGFGAGMKVK